MAAMQDPRFAPVRLAELDEINIEISVLSPLEEITAGEIQVGTHGLVVTRGTRRGVLLPQVATQFHWDAVRFLEETCMKAELGRNAWKQPETKVQAFTAEIFSEASCPSFRARVSRPASAARTRDERT
jgi:AmmeMemoRadiSam system protein A